MDEVEALASDSNTEMMPAVELAFLRAPVVLGPPVLDQSLNIGQVGAVIPALIWDLAWPAHPVESFA